jgi:hypothetical protein
MRMGRAGAHHAHASLDEMLSPPALSAILDRPVQAVRREPFTTAGRSSTGATFEAVYVDGAASPTLIAKTVRRGTDWVALATGDGVDREVWTWESGLLDRLRPPAAHAVLAGARSHDSYSIVMPDLSAHLLPDEHVASPPPAQQRLVVEALAALHAEFWMDDVLDDDRYGLSSLTRLIGSCSPSTLERVRREMGTSAIVEWIGEGWDKLPQLIDPGLAGDLRALADDPRPVVAAAKRFPLTLVHTDPRPANLAVDPGAGTVYFLDWTRPAPAPPAYDLLSWVFTGDRFLVLSREQLIDRYVAALSSRLGERFSPDWWDGQLKLGYLAFVVSFAGIMAQAMPGALPWWIERAMPALRAMP